MKLRQDLSHEDFGVGPLVVPIPGMDLSHVLGVRVRHLSFRLRALARVESFGSQLRKGGRAGLGKGGELFLPILRKALDVKDHHPS